MLFRLFKNLVFFNKRMAEVKSIQAQEGYSISGRSRTGLMFLILIIKKY